MMGVDAIESPLLGTSMPRDGRASAWNSQVDVVLDNGPTTVRGITIAFMDDHHETVIHHLVLHDQNALDPLEHVSLIAVIASRPEDIRTTINAATVNGWVPIAVSPPYSHAVTGYTIELGGSDT